MCGSGFRFDHGPHFIGGVKGTEGLVMHGAGEPHRPYVGYHHQGGEFHCQGVTVSWFLADARAGGRRVSPAFPAATSRASRLPPGVRSCDDDMGVVEQPEAEAGDVLFFMDGAQTHGTLRWNADHERRSILFKYAGRTATRRGGFAREVPARALLVRRDRRRHERRAAGGDVRSLLRPGTDEVFLRVDEDGTVRVDPKEG